MRIRRSIVLSLLLLSALPAVPEARAAQATARRQAAGKSAQGAVLAVDAAAKRLTIRGKRGNMTFAWDEATTMVGLTSPAYIKVSSSVTVQYATSAGVKKAVKITVNPPKRVMEQG
jgi:phage baseplate assembly protein gpV